MSRQLGKEELKIQEGPRVPFVTSLVAGILIMAGGIIGLLGIATLVIVPVSALPALILVFALPELICGLIVFIMAFVLYAFPRHTFPLGTVVVIVSVISVFFFGFGFFLIGLILGVIGGSLAITWKPLRIHPPSRSCLFSISVECPTRKVDPDIAIITLSESVCPICPIRIRMGLEGERPAKLTSSESTHTVSNA